MRRPPLLALALALACALLGHAQAQSVTCRDGTVLTGPDAGRMCVAHGGMPPGALGSEREPRGLSRPAQRGMTARGAAGPTGEPAPGGGPGQVWVNSSTKIYHCPGTQYYGRTKRGEYIAEAAAKAGGAHPAGGRACP